MKSRVPRYLSDNQVGLIPWLIDHLIKIQCYCCTRPYGRSLADYSGLRCMALCVVSLHNCDMEKLSENKRAELKKMADARLIVKLP
jgi:hypothetical protein